MTYFALMAAGDDAIGLELPPQPKGERLVRKSIKKLPSATPLALLVTMCVAPALAQNSRITPSYVKPGQLREMIAPAATVVSTSHYQAELGLTCSSLLCSGDFPKPGPKRLLNITRIACYIESPNSAFRFGAIDLIGPTGDQIMGETVPFETIAQDNLAPGYIATLSRAVDLQIAGNQHIRPHFDVNSGTGQALTAACTVTGTLSVLQ